MANSMIVIAVIKAIHLLSGYVIREKAVVLHTVMNRVTGILLFALPLTLSFVDLHCSGTVVCAAATFAASGRASDPDGSKEKRPVKSGFGGDFF